MSVHAYPRARWLVHATLTDALLVGVMIFFALHTKETRGPLAHALLLAIPAVFFWGVVTLHHPRVITLDDLGVAFSAYGRTHRYAWPDVERLSVRRFLVRDRVLVRISPAPPFSGRYWILDGVEGFGELVAELERRQRRGG